MNFSRTATPQSTSPREGPLTVALAGNPNSGKTTIFNALTGSRQHVGNYPGVTVEKKEGTARLGDGTELTIVDLPGTYSLTAYSLDEVVARNFILQEHPDVVIDILDASNLERNLYLATQLLELGVPLVLALNMSDRAEAMGLKIRCEMLTELLGVPVVPTVGNKGEGIEALLEAAVEAGRNPSDALAKLRRPNYGREVEPHVASFAKKIASCGAEAEQSRWFSVKLLEDDPQTPRRIREFCGDSGEEVLAEGRRLRKHIETVCGDSAEIILADRRYGYISGACTEAVTFHRSSVEARHSFSDQIDRIVAHPSLGLPIFALMMYLVFQLTFWVGTPLVGLLDQWINKDLASFLAAHWSPESGGILRSLVLDGILAGVGAVLVFVPLIVLLFLGIAFLEDSGYMARAAFLMDRLMHKIGLHGKSFVPMLIGFGCTVPAIMATRTLQGRRDRMTTILILPLMSCGARLPIYMLILPAFFPSAWHTPMLWGIYLIGILLAILMARLFRATLFRGQTAPFVMELPPYRVPTLKGLVVHMGERTWMYVRKAGTIILAGSIILWAITTFPQKTEFDRDYAAEIQLAETLPDAEKTEVLWEIAAHRRGEQLKHTVAGRIGRGMEPVLRTMGFDWKVGAALIGAFAAKEIFVSQLGIVYSLGEKTSHESMTLQEKLKEDYNPLVGFCIILFCLISMPCVATFAVTVREAGSWGWAMFQLGYLTVLAWGVTTAVYQVGRLWL